MTQELRHEYLRAIQERDAKIIKLKDDKAGEEMRVRTTAVEDVRENFKELVANVEKFGAEATNS
jgi:hypothetical protein